MTTITVYEYPGYRVFGRFTAPTYTDAFLKADRVMGKHYVVENEGEWLFHFAKHPNQVFTVEVDEVES